ncbi:unnamed protein product [Nyctereutes procyonoides]|uniref:(raccoon dog) hypothetical protein n=1 Tax=Nyctereutes procyonoides TaxID=34880 RepID=A0A811YKI3_NYCPR|nr:unnamed protein product [Nyctereutes procyonoides]
MLRMDPEVVYRKDCSNLLGERYRKRQREKKNFSDIIYSIQSVLPNFRAELLGPPQKKKKKKETTNVGEDEEKREPSYTDGGNNMNEKKTRQVINVKSKINQMLQLSDKDFKAVNNLEDNPNTGRTLSQRQPTKPTKLEGFHTQISKYFSERGDAVTKAAKQPHVGDYRQLVHELDEAEYRDIRLMVMEIRNAYAILYDIILKNFEKLKKPRGETKGMIY